MLKLNRLGWIFDPSEHGCHFSHAQVPTPFVLEDRVRIFFAGRLNGKSHVYSIDLMGPPPFTPNIESITLVMSPNDNPGTFDDEGVMPSCFFNHKDQWHFFYSGWNSRNTIPYHNSTGIAIYNSENNTIERKFQGPILERNHLHPYLAVTPTVWEDNGVYKALYISGISWQMGADRYEPIYVIKEAVSNDLVNWERGVDQVIASQYENECFSNPTVFRDRDQNINVLFCSRNGFGFRDDSTKSYSLQYAKRIDNKYLRLPIEWTGEAPDHRESFMQAYPHFFKWDGQLYVIYNGNGFGSTGFGLALVNEEGIDDGK